MGVHSTYRARVVSGPDDFDEAYFFFRMLQDVEEASYFLKPDVM